MKSATPQRGKAWPDIPRFAAGKLGDLDVAYLGAETNEPARLELYVRRPMTQTAPEKWRRRMRFCNARPMSVMVDHSRAMHRINVLDLEASSWSC